MSEAHTTVPSSQSVPMAEMLIEPASQCLTSKPKNNFHERSLKAAAAPHTADQRLIGPLGSLDRNVPFSV
ncbi:hypothetical protein NDU88_002757 [Pleurodeles waltl]|uniref:Uncharacterized protein n=1 Tax=Pleurodeles waltl TaxID=8319 RepID=A0AAV7NGC1_PLEWA|nr:hypothetical protein NDU88_002757 [Pleurodeles waltl]